MVFSDLNVGDCFKQGCRKTGCFSNVVLQKIETRRTLTGFANAQCVDDGLYHNVEGSRLVKQVNDELVLVN